MKNLTPATPVIPAFTPVPRKYRHDGWTPERQRAFISALAETGSVTHAAARINMSTEGAYQLRLVPGADEFRTAWHAALDHGVQRLEDIAMDRALYGVEVPVYSYGKLIGSRIVHNDRLLMFILRNRATERFGDRAMRVRLTQEQMAQVRAQWDHEQSIEREDAVARVKEEMDRVRERLKGHVDENGRIL